MGLSDFFFRDDKKSNVNIRDYDMQANPLDKMVSTGRRRTTESRSALTRVNPIDLEALYHQDEIVFNGMNLMSSVFQSAKYTINASTQAEADMLRKFLEDNDFDIIIERIVQDMCIYGNAWVELVMDKDTGNDMVRMVSLDPKSFDVSRGLTGKPTRDSSGRPQYYVQYLLYDMKAPVGAVEIQQYDLWGNFSRAIKLDVNNIAHFKLYTIGGDPLGIGLVEPMYNITKAKHSMRQGINQSTQRMGFPLIGFKVGDDSHHPTPEQLNNLYEKVKDINERTAFVHAHFIEPYILESKNATQMHEHLQHYESAQIATMGIPASLVTGAGEETNRSTLERQIYIWEKRVSLIQNNIKSVLEKTIFNQFAFQNNFSTVPTITFDEVSTESLFGRVDRWTKLTGQGLLTPDKTLEKYIRTLEKLPEVDESQTATPQQTQDDAGE